MEKIKPITIKLTGKTAQWCHEAAERAGTKPERFALNTLVDAMENAHPDYKPPAKKSRGSKSIMVDQLPSDRGRPPHSDCSCTQLCVLHNQGK